MKYSERKVASDFNMTDGGPRVGVCRLCAKTKANTVCIFLFFFIAYDHIVALSSIDRLESDKGSHARHNIYPFLKILFPYESFL